MRKIVLLLWMAALFSACRGNIEYSRFSSLPSDNWHVDSIVQFDYTIVDTTVDYQMLLYVRHTERYPYQNLWLFVDDNGSGDSIEFYLADDRGQWLGNMHHGFIEMPVLYEETKHFADTGAYTIRIAHGMRDTLLRGVTDIGLEIRRNGEK